MSFCRAQAAEKRTFRLSILTADCFLQSARTAERPERLILRKRRLYVPGTRRTGRKGEAPMFEKERERCYAGIKKCDSLLNIHANPFYLEQGMKGKSCSEVLPERLVDIWSITEEARKFYSLPIFYANAKLGFINRLVKMQEAENESSLV